MLRGSVRAPEGFSEGKPEAAKQRGAPRIFHSRFHTEVSQFYLLFFFYKLVEFVGGGFVIDGAYPV